MIENPNEIWEKRLQEAFKKKDKTETQLFLDVVSIILFNNDKARELGDLYSILKLEDFIKVVSLFENRTIEFPSKREIKEAIELSLFYYYKYIRGIDSYKELKSMNIIDEKEFSSKSIGKKLTKINEKLKEKIFEILMEMENKNGNGR
jgi:hypothetical protein